jgi:hypothetical protein
MIVIVLKIIRALAKSYFARRLATRIGVVEHINSDSLVRAKGDGASGGYGTSTHKETADYAFKGWQECLGTITLMPAQYSRLPRRPSPQCVVIFLAIAGKKKTEIYFIGEISANSNLNRERLKKPPEDR